MNCICENKQEIYNKMEKYDSRLQIKKFRRQQKWMIPLEALEHLKLKKLIGYKILK